MGEIVGVGFNLKHHYQADRIAQLSLEAEGII
jgi:hypothetical protein